MNKKHQFTQPVEILALEDQFISGVAPSVNVKTLPIQDSLQIKAAEYWLKLGEPDQALKELEGLQSRIYTHRWALKPRFAAIEVLRGRDEVTTRA